MNLKRIPTLVSLCISLVLWTGTTMAIDLAPLWDFSRPDVSEQRFRAALQQASGDEALILRTQIARSYGLRKDFATARNMLREIEAEVSNAGAEAQVRFQLELGRTFASAAHPAELLNAAARDQARQAFGSALELARAAGLDGLAIDAIHMFAFVDSAPADQLKWAEAALEIAVSSAQPEARRWEASIRNNAGYALHQLGRYDEALGQFQQAVALRERETDAEATRVARWMVAWTLRSLSRNGEALEIQLALEREAETAGKPDPYVFEELEALYRVMGEAQQAQHYAQLRDAARGAP